MHHLRAHIGRICPILAIIASIPLFVASFMVQDYRSGSFANLGATVGISGFLFLGGRIIIRQTIRHSDTLVMMVAAAVADSLRAHTSPDSEWRLNLIKEVADFINDDNDITLAAIQGTVVDLAGQVRAMRAQLDQLQDGH